MSVEDAGRLVPALHSLLLNLHVILLYRRLLLVAMGIADRMEFFNISDDRTHPPSFIANHIKYFSMKVTHHWFLDKENLGVTLRNLENFNLTRSEV